MIQSEGIRGKDAFFHLVREALNHLDDLPFLEASPLTRDLAVPGEPAGGVALRRRLLAAIELLRPPDTTPGADGAWRRYRCVLLRHVEGLSAERTCVELQVSGRQMRRDHLAGLEAVAVMLWSSYTRSRPSPEPAARSVSPTSSGLPTAESEALEAELVMLGSSPAEGPLSVEQTVLGAVDTVTRLAESRHVRIQLALPAQLPPAIVHRAVLRQILLSLLSFAIEGLAIEGLAIEGLATENTTTERTDPEDKAIRARVMEDVAAATRRRLSNDPDRQIEVGGASGAKGVELFISVWPITDRVALSDDHRLEISARLVSLQGGDLRLECRPPGELVFRIVLPAAPPTTVLVIDDNPDLGRLFQRYLWAGGYQMLQASTGSQALRLAREAQPQVITLDVMMPSQDGWEVLRELRQDPKVGRIPVVICSVLRERDLAFSLGADDFLAKPVSQQALLTTLEQCLRGARTT